MLITFITSLLLLLFCKHDCEIGFIRFLFLWCERTNARVWLQKLRLNTGRTIAKCYPTSESELNPHSSFIACLRSQVYYNSIFVPLFIYY